MHHSKGQLWSVVVAVEFESVTQCAACEGVARGACGGQHGGVLPTHSGCDWQGHAMRVQVCPFANA